MVVVRGADLMIILLMVLRFEELVAPLALAVAVAPVQ